MQVITKDHQVYIKPGCGYIGRGLWHKHRFRASYQPTFYHVGFVCRNCDLIIVLERDVWHEMIRLGRDWYLLWKSGF